ncbi:hypothetical protein [Methanolobus halotolerans]|uniref:S-layer family duplication domain-containing protein n=1 Tax=Methanolobus halotolerans TaxID=2052935 RepID=A0A4E0PXM7_9EURY|nr:hypothetical protein [Methanolobus halotolerans]TGC10968.1 hypothetical protein CUN85_02100 [Methanolobus halotolerans]
MKYIHFAIICACVFFLCISPAAGLTTKAMIHYSEPGVSVRDVVSLEQGYSFKVLDMNSKSGDILIELYLDGEKIELEDNFARVDDSLEYVRPVIEYEGEGNEKDVDHLILSITPEGSVKTSDGIYHSTILIEQYLDPLENINDYLILDKDYSLKSGSELELTGLYTLEVTGMDYDEVSLELRFSGRKLKKADIEEGEYFHYTVYSDTGPQTIFLAYVKGLFETDDGITVFLDHVSLQQDQISDNIDSPESIDIDIVSPLGGGLKAGCIAIINYCLDDSYPEVRIMVDGQLLDTRKDVSPGTYKAVTEELYTGIHKATLMTIDYNDDRSYYSEEFSVSVNIKDNITGSIAGFANSATEGLGKDNSSENVSSNMNVPSLPSNLSNTLSLIVTAGVFIVLFWFFRKFL